ncbi:MAG: T9SS type A sorting domain-containing protein [Candidatus Latescibacteria bacterium]|nr:T9SS type A sorting domain-containing protein [Candidatus Latescibacterota bacterium]
MPGRVVAARPARLLGQAVVNFAYLAEQEELSGPSPISARPRIFHRGLEDPLEPEAVLSTAGPQGPSAPSVASPPASASFIGLDDIPMVDSSYIVIPPDTGGAVGLTKLMSGLNNNYRIFDKSDGSVISTLGTATFWAPSGETALNGLTDPRTLYDPYNNRWIAVMQTVTTGAGNILVGVSHTSDPTGNWFLYRFATGATIDFPTVGFNKNWIVVAINRYSNGGTFQRGITLVVNYPLALTGTGSGVIFTQQPTTHFVSSPCATYSATAETLYVVTHLSSSGATYTLDMITGTAASPSYTAGGSQTRTGGGWAQPGGQLLPQSAPNSGTSSCGATPCAIETQDAQVRSAPVCRDGYIYYTQTIGLPASGLTHTGVQWTKLNTPSGGFVDGGRIEDATANSTNGGKWYAFPHIAVNSVSDFMVGYSQFSSAQHPSAGYSMRLAGDAAGTIRDPLIYKPGEDYYHKDFGSGRNRWGDFSQAQVDPSDDRSLWTVQEYGKFRVSTNDGTTGANGSRWSTYWANVAGPAPIVTIESGQSQSEGDAGLTAFTFTVNLSTGYSLPVTIDYQTADGTATIADNDYEAASGSITIPAGETSGVITVNALGDTNNESDEMFDISLTFATNGVIGSPGSSTGTILNDDDFTITATAGSGGTISPSGVVIVAPGGSQSFTIAHDACHTIADVLVDGVSAGAVTEYTFTNVSANHTIAASFTLITYTITASAGDGGAISPSGAVSVGCGSDQAFTITTDPENMIGSLVVDAVSLPIAESHTFTNVTAPHSISASFQIGPRITIGDLVLVEGNSGTTEFGFPVKLSGPATMHVDLTWKTVDVTAVASSGDYEADSTVLSIDAGATTAIIPVQVNGDLTPEDQETFLVNLPGAMHGIVADGEAVGMIINDDGATAVESGIPAELSFAIEGGNPGGGAVRFRLGLPSSGRVALHVYDVAGRLVGRAVDGILPAGSHGVSWSVQREGAHPASGVYFVRFAANGRTITRRFVLLR